MYSKSRFLITIDTEGDNLWAKPDKVTTKNAAFLPRFQSLCEKYGFKPTYLTNFEMASSREFQEIARGILSRGAAEIGMHLHAWNMPPSFQLTENDAQFTPYLIEYPEQIMRDKVAFMTDLLEETFGMPVVSHRAGRWSIDTRYVNILIERGYKVDCSVTPHISWAHATGHPTRNGGSDYRNFPDYPYLIDPSDISLPGNSTLLEVPVSIRRALPGPCERLRIAFTKFPIMRSFSDRHVRCFYWLRPDGHNLVHMLKILKATLHEGKDYVEFVLHSSELMPGGSPLFVTQDSIERLYEDLEILFSTASEHFQSSTLIEYYGYYTEKVSAHEVH